MNADESDFAKSILQAWLSVAEDAARQQIWDRVEARRREEMLHEWKSIAGIHAARGELTDAERIAQALFNFGSQTHDSHVCAFAHWIWGNIYTISGDYAGAKVAFDHGADIYQRHDDRLNLARMNVGLVGALTLSGEHKDALAVGHSTWDILAGSADESDRARQAGLANNLGIACEYLGRFEEALDFYTYKLNYWTTKQGDSKAQVEMARARINLAVAEKRLNLLYRAYGNLMEATALFADQTLAASYPDDHCRAYMHVALLLIAQKAPTEKIEDAFAQARTFNPGTASLVDLDINEAMWQLSSRNLPSDYLPRMQNLEQLCRDSEQIRQALVVRLLVAGYHIHQANTESALEHCQSVLDMCVDEHWDLRYRALCDLGEAYLILGESQRALESFEESVWVSSAIGERLRDEDLRIGFRHHHQSALHHIANIHLEDGNLPQFLAWIELAKATELAQHLAHTLERAGAVHDPLQNPHMFRPVVSLDDLQAAMPKNTQMLIYTEIHGRLWGLVIDRENSPCPVDLGPAPDPFQIENELRWLYRMASYPADIRARHVEQLIDASVQQLHRWYVQYLSPLAEPLSSACRLILVLDGALNRLPFHAFCTSAQGHYLLESHEINYAPSASSWYALRQKQPSSQHGLALGHDGNRLHHTASELEAIRQVWPTIRTYHGSAANRSAILDADLSQIGCLHLAAHGQFRIDDPSFSTIHLADGQIGISDIRRLQLDAATVVLSACETGRGIERGGEHLSLPWAFLMAGARTVIAGHWLIDDEASVVLMRSLYASMFEGLSPAAALRHAQLEMMKSSTHFQHPYYWAPFFSLGF